MRILIDLTLFRPDYVGGTQTYITNFIKFSKNTFDIIVLTNITTNSEISNFLGPGIEYFPIKPRNDLIIRLIRFVNFTLIRSTYIHKLIQNYVWRIGLIKKSLNFDCVYYPNTYLNFSLNKYPKIVSLHDIQEKAFPEFFGTLEKIERSLLTKYTLRYASKIQVSSNFIESHLTEVFGKNSISNKVVVISEGVDTKVYECSKKKLSKPIRILMAANLWPHKNHKYLLDNLTNIRNLNDFEFIFIGNFTRDAFLTKFNQTEKFGESLNVIGRLSELDKIEITKSCQVVISCSLYESSSLPILEGSAAGCEIYASDIPAHRELSHSIKMNLFSLNDSKLFEILNQYSTNIEEKLIEKDLSIYDFDWAQVVGKYHSLFQTLVSRRNS
jgi:glycosyltransferase involved in cell wall biosynthesis